MGRLARRALPRLGRGWPPVAGLISGVLLDGVLKPAPGGSRPALRAWGRLSAAIREAQDRTGPAGPDPALSFVTVDVADVAELGAAAWALGDSLPPDGRITATAGPGTRPRGRRCSPGPVR